jgi:hypothetical protein
MEKIFILYILLIKEESIKIEIAYEQSINYIISDISNSFGIPELL